MMLSHFLTASSSPFGLWQRSSRQSGHTWQSPSIPSMTSTTTSSCLSMVSILFCETSSNSSPRSGSVTFKNLSQNIWCGRNLAFSTALPAIIVALRPLYGYLPERMIACLVTRKWQRFIFYPPPISIFYYCSNSWIFWPMVSINCVLSSKYLSKKEIEQYWTHIEIIISNI